MKAQTPRKRIPTTHVITFYRGAEFGGYLCVNATHKNSVSAFAEHVARVHSCDTFQIDTPAKCSEPAQVKITLK